jgi:hypothetical protein
MAKTGLKANLFYNTASYGSPTWAEITLVADCAVEGTRDEAGGSTRASSVKLFEPTQLALGISGKVRTDSTDTGFAALLANFLDPSTAIDVLVLDGTTTENGSLGYRFDAKVFSMGEDQALNSVLFRDFTIKPCISANPVKSVLVTSGAPVFTTLA